MHSTGLAYLLWVVSGCGALGFHRFYLGKIGTGILWMLTGGLLGIGSIYDLVTMPKQVREANILKSVRDGSIRFDGTYLHSINGSQTSLISEREDIEHVILRVAKTNNGIITASELALAGRTSIEEAKRALDTMVTKGHAELRVRQSGTLVYSIPDLMDNNEPLVDL